MNYCKVEVLVSPTDIPMDNFIKISDYKLIKSVENISYSVLKDVVLKGLITNVLLDILDIRGYIFIDGNNSSILVVDLDYNGLSTDNGSILVSLIKQFIRDNILDKLLQ